MAGVRACTGAGRTTQHAQRGAREELTHRGFFSGNSFQAPAVLRFVDSFVSDAFIGADWSEPTNALSQRGPKEAQAGPQEAADPQKVPSSSYSVEVGTIGGAHSL